MIPFQVVVQHSCGASRRRSLYASLCWLYSRRAADDRSYLGPSSARVELRARRAAARPAGACAHRASDSSCSSKRVRHLAACREAAASTASTSRRSALPAWRSARPERGLRRQVARALPRRRGGSLAAAQELAKDEPVSGSGSSRAGIGSGSVSGTQYECTVRVWASLDLILFWYTSADA